MPSAEQHRIPYSKMEKSETLLTHGVLMESLCLSVSSLSQNVSVHQLLFMVHMRKENNCFGDVALTNGSALTVYTKTVLNPEV